MKQIRLQNIRKIYDEGKESAVHALQNITYTFDPGKVYAIMGASGSGKSTLLQIMGTLNKPTGGEYYWDEEAIHRLPEHKTCQLRANNIGYVLQDFGLIEEASVIENVMAPAIFAGDTFQQARKKANLALERIGIAYLSRRQATKLSGGQRQRVAIARAIVNEPCLILADEPTGALDSTTTNDVLHALLDLHSQDSILILATHSQDVAQKCDCTLTIVDGVFQDLHRE